MQLTKIKDFFIGDHFTSWFIFLWVSISALDCLFFVILILIRRGRLGLVMYGLRIAQLRLLLTSCQLAYEDLIYWNFYYAHKKQMSGTSIHEAYTAYRAFIFAFTALGVFFNTFLNMIVVDNFKT